MAPAQSTGLEDMVGARAGQAEGELQRRGYRNTGGEKGDDRSYTYWWNEGRGQCVTIATMDGRYSSITPTTAPDCKQRPRREERSTARDRDWRGEQRDRDDRDERHRTYVAADALSRICRSEAAEEFDRRPSEVTANYPIEQRDGYLVQGWFDRTDGSKRTTFFNCRFDLDGRLISVR